MHTNEPEIAARWEADTPDDAKLPDRVRESAARELARKRGSK